MNTTKNIPARYLITTEEGNDEWLVNIHCYTEQDLFNKGITTIDFVEDIGEEANWINVMLTESNSYGLINEVVQFALKAMQEDTRLTPAQALQIGYSEWIK
jgi:hypothetical protein